MTIVNRPNGETAPIDVLVVGAGIGGLFTAIELHRHGNRVPVIESKKGVGSIGKYSHREQMFGTE